MNALAPIGAFAFPPEMVEAGPMSASPDFGAIRPEAGWRTEPVVAKPLRWRGPLAASFALHALALVAMLVWTSDATDSTAPEPIEVEIVAAPLVEAPPVAEPSPTPVAEAPPAPPVVEPPPPAAEGTITRLGRLG